MEVEIRELLGVYGFDEDDTPVIIGSALCALEVGQLWLLLPYPGHNVAQDSNEKLGRQAILKLMDAVDTWYAACRC